MNNFIKDHWSKLVSAIAIVLSLFAGGCIGVSIEKTDTGTQVKIQSNFSIELADKQTPALVVDENGEQEFITVPTVEEIDSAQDIKECGENEECGRGEYFDVSTPQAFANAILNKCVDTDGYYGSQCYDTANAFFINAVGRWLSTCGTGAAKGTISEGCWQKNAGDDFEMIWSPEDLQPGDIPVFVNGTWGHIGMAMGTATNGYISLLSTNQGGAACPGGGSTANIINISLKNFGGAFRWKGYKAKEEPKKPETPEIPISGCLDWNVKKGDTMSLIMLTCEGGVVYGEAMNSYAKTWVSRYYVPGQTVYDGWNSKSGVGLYAGDTIDHEVGK